MGKLDMKVLTNDGETCNGFELEGKSYYLLDEVDIAEIGEPLEVLRQFAATFDLSYVKTEEKVISDEWDDDEDLREYLGNRSKLQFHIFKSAMKEENWKLIGDMKEDLDSWKLGPISSQQIAGARSGNRRAAKNWYGKEPLDEKQWDTDADESTYRIKPEYLDLLRKVLPEVEKKRKW